METLHHAVFVIRPGRYFVRWPLRLSGLHLNEGELAGGGGAWRRTRREVDAERELALREGESSKYLETLRAYTEQGALRDTENKEEIVMGKTQVVNL